MDAERPGERAEDAAAARRESAERERFLWQIWFQQAQQLAWLAAAGAGAALLFLEGAAPGKPARRATIAFVCFGLSATLAVISQGRITDALWDEKRPQRERKLVLGLAYMLLGAGAGALFMVVTG